VQTIGSLLKSLRLKKEISLENISQETNIAPHLLKHLENDDYSHLPSNTFTKGFISKYAQIVGLSSQKALAIFRRDFIIDESGRIMPRGLVKPLDKPTFITSKIFSIFGATLLLFIILGYLFFQLKNFKNSPNIEITRPKPNTVVKGPIISIKGFVSTDSTVYVNDAIADVFPTGEFHSSVHLEQGEQIIKIKAINSQQKQTQIEIPVHVVDK
jgi:cytoskeletal protein RodZ